MSKERINLIESFGATIRLVSKAEGGFTGSIALADRMGETEGAFLPHQFSNPENCAAHYATTGKEILAQLAAFGKRPQGFVAGVGTGGTLMGVKDILQESYPDCLAFPSIRPPPRLWRLAEKSSARIGFSESATSSYRLSSNWISWTISFLSTTATPSTCPANSLACSGSVSESHRARTFWAS